MKSVYAVLVLLSIAYHAYATTNAECVDKLTKAQTKWNTLLNISASLNWNDPVSLRQALEGAFASSSNKVSAFQAVCQGHKEFKADMTPDYSWNGCINPIRLITTDDGNATSTDEWTARNYFSIHVAFDFICGTGYPIFINNAECMGSQIFGAHRADIDAVYDVFWMMVKRTWSGLGSTLNPRTSQMICTEVDIAARSQNTQNLVFQQCGSKVEIQYFGCEYFRQSLQYHATWCTTIDCSCTKSPCYSDARFKR